MLPVASRRMLEIGLSGALRIVYLSRNGLSWSINGGAGRRREKSECIEGRVSHRNYDAPQGRGSVTPAWDG